MTLEQALARIQLFVSRGKTHPAELLCALLDSFSEEIQQKLSETTITSASIFNQGPDSERKSINETMRHIVQELILMNAIFDADEIMQPSQIREEKEEKNKSISTADKEELLEEKAEFKEERRKNAFKKIKKLIENIQDNDRVFNAIHPIIQAVALCSPALQKEIGKSSEKVQARLSKVPEIEEKLVEDNSKEIQVAWDSLLNEIKWDNSNNSSQTKQQRIKLFAEKITPSKDKVGLFYDFFMLCLSMPDRIPPSLKPILLNYVIFSSIDQGQGIIYYVEEQNYDLFEFLVSEKTELFSEAISALTSYLQTPAGTINFNSKIWRWFFEKGLSDSSIREENKEMKSADLNQLYYNRVLSSNATLEMSFASALENPNLCNSHKLGVMIEELIQCLDFMKVPESQLNKFVNQLVDAVLKLSSYVQKEGQFSKLNQFLSHYPQLHQQQMRKLKNIIDEQIKCLREVMKEKSEKKLEIQDHLKLLYSFKCFVHLSPKEHLHEVVQPLQDCFDQGLLNRLGSSFHDILNQVITPLAQKSSFDPIQKWSQQLIIDFEQKKMTSPIEQNLHLGVLNALWPVDAPWFKRNSVAYSVNLTELLSYMEKNDSKTFIKIEDNQKQPPVFIELLSKWFLHDPKRLELFLSEQKNDSRQAVPPIIEGSYITPQDDDKQIQNFILSHLKDPYFEEVLFFTVIANATPTDARDLILKKLRARLFDDPFDFTKIEEIRLFKNMTEAMQTSLWRCEDRPTSYSEVIFDGRYLPKKMFNTLYKRLREEDSKVLVVLVNLVGLFNFKNDIQESAEDKEDIKLDFHLIKELVDLYFKWPRCQSQLVSIIEDLFAIMPQGEERQKAFTYLITESYFMRQMLCDQGTLSLAERQQVWDSSVASCTYDDSAKYSNLFKAAPVDQIIPLCVYVLQKLPDCTKPGARQMSYNFLKKLFAFANDEQKPLILHGLLVPQCVHDAGLRELSGELLAQSNYVNQRQQLLMTHLHGSEAPVPESLINIVNKYL